MKKENSTNSINQEVLNKFCSTYKIFSQITGRWKISIILLLQNNKKSYTQIKSSIPNITDRVLAKQLSELRFDKIIDNEKNKVQSNYFLTSKGEKFLLLLKYVDELNLR